MTVYLIEHYKISLILLIPVMLLFKYEILSNKLRLYVLYAFLIKSMIPWGFFTPSVSLVSGDAVGSDFSSGSIADITANNSDYFVNLFPHELILTFLYLPLAMFFLFLYFRSLFRLHRKVRNSELCDDSDIQKSASGLFGVKYSRIIEIRVSDEIHSPFIWWTGKWTIILSESVLYLNASDKTAILAHEFAHIQRRDLIKYFILMSVKSLFFFSPFIFLLVNRIIEHEETEADLLAMRLTGISADNFGKTLLKFVSLPKPFKYNVPTLAISKKRRLTMRLKRLFQTKSTMGRRLANTWVVAVTLVVLLVNFTSTASTLNYSSTGTFINPVKIGRLTQRFGENMHPITKKMYFHKGIDLAAKKGTTIAATADGKVSAADNNGSEGNYIILQHADGYSSLYSHLDKITVSEGDLVKRGETIGELGNTGVSIGPHVHFEIRKDGKHLDPLELIEND